MHIRSLAFVALGAISAASLSARSQTSSVSARLSAQNAIFEEYWQNQLRFSPTLATAVGDFRYNDQLRDYTVSAEARQHQVEAAFLARLQAIPTTGFSEEDRTSHDLFLRELAQDATDFHLKQFEMPLNYAHGIHTSLADLPLSMPFDSVKHYEDYIARLHQIPRVMLQNEDVLRAGIKDHLVIVRFIAEKVPAQCQGVITANPFLLPTRKFPASFSDADKQRLTSAINEVLNTEVFPAYQHFSAFITATYIPAARTSLSIESLPDGKQRYANDLRRLTTTSYTPHQIHDIGLGEFSRIIAEMTTLAKASGYPDLAGFRDHIENDPKYQPASEQAIVSDFDRYIQGMRPKLPLLFTVIPSAPVTVEGIPSFQAAASTHYQSGTPDGKRPGRVSVAVSDFAKRSLINDEAVAYHEGIPGHHMQISIQQNLPGLPEFRKHGGNSAYIEGWGLYAEQLGKEVGFYQDPGSDYGRLRSELFRAVRLVVDTGIHDMGWSREQVVDYMRQSHAIDEPTIQAETDRYISMPAQACAYKLGQLKIRDLRARATAKLGSRFDVRTFHDEILSGGSLPLDVLDARVTRWIETQLPAHAGN